MPTNGPGQGGVATNWTLPIILLIGLVVFVIVGGIVHACWQSQHRYDVSCDQRLHPKNPQDTCTDYYGDYGPEVECTPETMKHTPCAREGVLGGCHQKTHIEWHYRGKDTKANETWSSHCLSDEKVLPADWKEPEAR